MTHRARFAGGRRFGWGLALGSAAALLGAGATAATDETGEVVAMIRRVLASPQATARVTIERSDPFGGPPTRERGRIWFLPGRGLRYRSSEKGGQDVVIDRAKDTFLMYSPQEEVLYRGAYGRAPARLRRLIAEPEQEITSKLSPVAEKRDVRGAPREGYRLRAAAIGESEAKVSVWVSREGGKGLPRFVSLATDVDTVLVEFREWKFHAKARPADLVSSAPKGVREEPLDPREMLERAGPGGSR
jgi:hypothetical protein